MRATVVLTEVGQGLRRNLGLTVAVILTVLVAGLLGGLSIMLHKQVDTMKDYWYDKVEVSIFLCWPAELGALVRPAGRDRRAEGSRSRPTSSSSPLVENVYYESQQQAYEHFKEQFKQQPDIVNSRARRTRCRESYRVKLKDPSRYADMASEFQGRPGIEQVQDSRAIFDQHLQHPQRVPADQSGHLAHHGRSRRCCSSRTPSASPRSRDGARPASCGWSVRPTCRSGCRSCSRR